MTLTWLQQSKEGKTAQTTSSWSINHVTWVCYSQNCGFFIFSLSETCKEDIFHRYLWAQTETPALHVSASSHSLVPVVGCDELSHVQCSRLQGAASCLANASFFFPRARHVGSSLLFSSRCCKCHLYQKMSDTNYGEFVCCLYRTR